VGFGAVAGRLPAAAAAAAPAPAAAGGSDAQLGAPALTGDVTDDRLTFVSKFSTRMGTA